MLNALCRTSKSIFNIQHKYHHRSSNPILYRKNKMDNNDDTNGPANATTNNNTTTTTTTSSSTRIIVSSGLTNTNTNRKRQFHATATATATNNVNNTNTVNVNVLPKPSKEQIKIIEAINNGYCVTVKACAGSGKTTCMLQVASSLPPSRTVIIITYNRSLADECKMRIKKLGLQHNKIKCYTIHGFVTFLTGTICNDDHKLIQQLDSWDREGYRVKNPIPLDLVMLDEAQDLRPLFHKTLSYIFGSNANTSTINSTSTNNSTNNSTSTSLSNTSTTSTGGGTGTGTGIQLCLVGDPKQLLYDFATYGNDKASASFFLQPEQYWGKFTSNRKWIQLPLSVSYRLTPNIASFCNLFWGTNMIGGNTASPNIPVEYLIKYPYPSNRGGNDDPEKLNTSFLAKIIDQHGPENVIFLANSIKSDTSPIRVHVNELMNIKDPMTGERKYNFHIKESVRGFEGVADLKNKVRVWTFCGSKGCEADVVIVFGFDVFNGRPHSLNQIGVALSRAKKRLIIIHGQKKDRLKGGDRLVALPYYPVLGDSIEGMKQHTIKHSGRQDNSEEEEEIITIDVPFIEQQGGGGSGGGGSGSGTGNSSIQDVYEKRSELSRQTMNQFVKSGVISIDCGTSRSDNPSLPRASSSGIAQKESLEVYVASDFNYFSASAETKYLRQYGVKWTTTNDIFHVAAADDMHGSGLGGVGRLGVNDNDDDIIGRRIPYKTDVQFTTTKEDVSALYGEAVTYMLQWELCKFVPNIETIVSNGLLRLLSFGLYGEKQIRKMLSDMGCEPLTSKDDETLTNEFTTVSMRKIKGQDLIRFMNNRMNIKKNGLLRLHSFTLYREKQIRKMLSDMGCEPLTSKDDETLTNEFTTVSMRKIKGQDLIRFMNNRMNIKKKRQSKTTSTSDGNDSGDKGDNNWIIFPVKAVEQKKDDDDNQLIDFLPEIRTVYDLHVKKPFQWIYLANAVMAFSNYHEKFRQIGTEPNSYESWVNSNALLTGLERLKGIMARISSSTSDNLYDVNSGTFERELSYDFKVNDCIKEENNGKTIVGVGGICDWVIDVSLKKKRCYSNKKQHQQQHKQQQQSYAVDLLEIKFVHQLSNAHRLQVLVYCALYALELNNNSNGENENENDDSDDEYIDEFNDNDSNFLRRSECSGMLYNARTGEIEICSIQTKDAKQFLLDISQFKYNGIERHQQRQQQTSNIVPYSKETKKENGVVSNNIANRDRADYGALSSSTPSSSSASSWPLKKRFRNGFAKSKNDITADQSMTAATADAAVDNDDGTLSSTATSDRSVSWPKRPKKSYMNRLNHAKQNTSSNNNTTNIDLTNQEAGTDDDPIVLD